jgi:glycosyltransferase involved in cell wall biosynthesis
VRARYGIGDGPYILSVGTIQPRKNYERLIRALAALPSAFDDVRLVIVGGRGWLQESIYQTVEALKLGERVLFPGFAEDGDLPALYSGARLAAYPSLYEGFGLPILEAMRCGTPVLSSHTSSLREVAGEAALLIDPLSVESIRDGLLQLLSDDGLCARLREAGSKQSKLFAWDDAAEKLEKLYKNLLSV